MLRARLLTGTLILANSAMTLFAAAPASAQTYAPPAPVVSPAPMTGPMTGMEATTEADANSWMIGEDKTAIWRATDDWDNSWQGWDIDTGGPSILLVRR